MWMICGSEQEDPLVAGPTHTTNEVHRESDNSTTKQVRRGATLDLWLGHEQLC